MGKEMDGRDIDIETGDIETSLLYLPLQTLITELYMSH